MKKTAIVVSTAVLIAASIACSSPSSPTGSASGTSGTSGGGTSTASSNVDAGKVVVDKLTGVSLTAPKLSTPNDAQTFKYVEQPLTLVVKNAAATGATPTYTFQVATDAAFSSPVVSQDVAQGANGSTSLVLPKLAGAKTYFWRARATSSGTVGLFATARTFSVGPEVVLQAPVLASPGSGASVSGTVSFTVNNVQRSGPVTAITYRFDLTDSSSFSHILSSTTAAEQPGTTSVAPSVTLGAGTDRLACAGVGQRERCVVAAVGHLGLQLSAIQPVAGQDGQFAAGLRQLGGDRQDYERHVLPRFVLGGLRPEGWTRPLD